MAANRSGGLLWFSMGILLLFCSAKAKAKDGGPLAQVNLSPFRQWRSAYECVKNYSTKCLEKHELNLTGAVWVSKAEISDYCKPGGCIDHINYVLTCAHYVKRDLKFANSYTVDFVRSKIADGCNNNSAIYISQDKPKSSSAARMYKGWPITLLSALPTVLLMMIFNI